MKTPVQMLEDVAAEIIENTSLLELIYKNSNEEHETDCAMACLIRSMQKTLDTANEYIGMLSGPSAPPPPSGPKAEWILRMRYSARYLRLKSWRRSPVFMVNPISRIKTMITLRAISLRSSVIMHTNCVEN